MDLIVRPSRLKGSVVIPGSKSHTIRAVLLAALAEGSSIIRRPLDSKDAQSAVVAARALGAQVKQEGNLWVVHGIGGRVRAAGQTIDVGNSGTTITLAASAAALGSGAVTLTGDAQIQRRPNGPLAAALRQLGVRVDAEDENAFPPLTVQGPLQGGRCELDACNSQYLTSLLLACPLAVADTEIEVTRLYEKPYVEITLAWLDFLRVRYQQEGMRRFRIFGNQTYPSFDRAVPGDFSTATFFLVGAAVAGGEVELHGLDMRDPQGDKAVIDMLREMGAEITLDEGAIRVKGSRLRGAEFDLNATPDALPAMAVAAALAEGTTVLGNVPQARIKETDRLAVMNQELSALGAKVTERDDALEITGQPLLGRTVDGHGDHRVVMALALAGLCAEGETRIKDAEAMAITNPQFVEMLHNMGGELELVQ